MPVELRLRIIDGTASVPLGECPDVPDAIPPPLAHIKAAFANDWVIVDDRLIEQVVGAFDLPRDAEAALGSPVEVWRFLRQHAGAHAYIEEVPSPPATPATDAEVDALPIAGHGGRASATEDEERKPATEGRPWQTAAGVTAWRARGAPGAPERAAERSGGRAIRQMLTLIARAFP